jgi:hypothetical protein
MINFIQLNQNITQWEENIITDEIWETIYTILQEPNNFENLIQYVHNISIQYNTDKKNIIKSYYQYIIRNKKHIITSEYLKKVETIMHFRGTNVEHILLYFSTPVKN